MLVMGGQNPWMDDSAPGHIHTFVDWLRADNSGGADFIGDLPSLVEDKCEKILIICNGDDGLYHELPVPNDGGAVGTVVGMFPEDAGVLLMNTDYIRARIWVALVVREDCIHIVNSAEAVTAEFKVVGHDPGTDVAQIKGCFAVQRGPGVCVGDVHIGEGESVEETAVVIPNL